MRRMSTKQRQRTRLARQLGDTLAMELGGRCEYCREMRPLDRHEIAGGPDRHKAMVERSCVLMLCRSCHGIVQNWSKPKQLELLQASRPDDYDLERFVAVRGNRRGL